MRASGVGRENAWVRGKVLGIGVIHGDRIDYSNFALLGMVERPLPDHHDVRPIVGVYIKHVFKNDAEIVVLSLH